MQQQGLNTEQPFFQSLKCKGQGTWNVRSALSRTIEVWKKGWEKCGYVGDERTILVARSNDSQALRVQFSYCAGSGLPPMSTLSTCKWLALFPKFFTINKGGLTQVTPASSNPRLRTPMMAARDLWYSPMVRIARITSQIGWAIPILSPGHIWKTHRQQLPDR